MRLLPRDEKFFDMFIAVSERTHEAAVQLEKILLAQPDQRTFLVESVKRLEHECDQITQEVITRLDRSFITPLDREDIHALASGLDDVIDLIDGLARRTRIFHVGEAPKGAILLTQVIQRACEQLLLAVRGLQKNGKEVLVACMAVKRLEEEGDSLYHEWLGKMFEGETDPMIVIKWKELYDNLEKTLDYAEDAANVLESISIKHG